MKDEKCCVNTVTISLHDYDSMKYELAQLTEFRNDSHSVIVSSFGIYSFAKTYVTRDENIINEIEKVIKKEIDSAVSFFERKKDDKQKQEDDLKKSLNSIFSIFRKNQLTNNHENNQ